MKSIDQLLPEFEKGNRRALAKLLTKVENRADGLHQTLDKLYANTGDAWRLGVTGPPGAGKSTLVNQLVLGYREKDLPVGVIAFDPTSPFTGGALLGDRVRMPRITLDPGVFIRSMATRGHLGGLAVGVDEACDLLDAFGKKRILIETVGVGQSELEVAHSADTTIVVLVPQSGDMIQAMKAGLMEIADIFVLNKCDRDGADTAYRELTSALHMKEAIDGWSPPVIKTIAEDGKGIDELADTIQQHRDHLINTGNFETRRKQRVSEKIRRLVEDDIQNRLWSGKREHDRINFVDKSPYEISAKLRDDFYAEIKDEK